MLTWPWPSALGGTSLGLFDGNLVHVAESLRAGRALNGLDRDVLHLALGFFQLFVKHLDLGGLPSYRILQRLDLKLGNALFGFAVLLDQEHLPLELTFGRFGGVRGSLLDLAIQPVWEIL